MPKRKRQVQEFSVSFLDCICCGFGAVILLFVLTSGKKSEARNEQLSDVSVDLGKLQKNIKAEDVRLRLLASLLRPQIGYIKTTDGLTGVIGLEHRQLLQKTENIDGVYV